MKQISRIRVSVPVFLTTFFTSAIFLLPLCGFLFQCGCTYLWAGGVAHCNIYQADSPNCPWCHGSPGILFVSFLVIYGGQGFAIFYFSKKSGFNFIKLTAVGLIAFLLLALIVAYLDKLIYDYPYFLVK